MKSRSSPNQREEVVRENLKEIDWHRGAARRAVLTSGGLVQHSVDSSGL